ncbi:MAG: helix-turn-helix transcriptional regulator [Pseudomonadales bacterium]|nr:helix-turn-helix transcriptional regulator [Pseudomonadales bacterium]
MPYSELNSEKKIKQSRIQAWNRCFIKQDLSLTISREDAPYRRLSITVIVACGNPFTIRDHNNDDQTLHGALLGPNVSRTNIDAIDSDLTILDAFITTQKYKALQAIVKPYEMRALTGEELTKAQEICRPSFYQDLEQEDAGELFDSIVNSLCDPNAPKQTINTRISKVTEIVEQRRAEDLSVSALAKEANTSESHLRSLFKKEMHCTLSQYIRSVSVWKTVPLLAKGMSYTEVAHEAGFHDLAHYSKAVLEVIGSPPSNILKTDSIKVSLHSK